VGDEEIVKEKKSRPRYEVVIILLVVIAALVVALGISRVQSKSERGRILISELAQLRAAITTYVALNKTNPSNIESLAEMSYSFSLSEKPRSYLDNISANQEGKLIDPFGNPYLYDAKLGRVSSSSSGFEGW